jgi:FkbM family methyltransferase
MTIFAKLAERTKRTARKFGYEIVRSDRMPQQTMNILRLGAALLPAGPITAVQIGANDGQAGDPLRDLIFSQPITTLLVEPVPSAFAALKENYSGIPGILFENAAIASHDGQMRLYVPDGAEGFSSRQASMSREHLVRHGVPASKIREIHVPCLTLSTLMTRHSLDRIDILVTDVEGYDYEIVAACFREGISPHLLYFEHAHLNRDHRRRAREVLGCNDYKFIEGPSDTLAVAAELFEHRQ